MSEEDWMVILADSANLAEVLPYLQDWYEEQGEGGKAAFCKWLLRRSQKVAIGPCGDYYYGWYWWARRFSRKTPYPFLFNEDLPEPLFRHGLKYDTRPDFSPSSAGENLPDKKTAWWEAFKAWGKAWETEELAPWMELLNQREK